jgi:hypothetical protein
MERKRGLCHRLFVIFFHFNQKNSLKVKKYPHSTLSNQTPTKNWKRRMMDSFYLSGLLPGQSSEWPLGISGSMKSAYTTCKIPNNGRTRGLIRLSAKRPRVLHLFSTSPPPTHSLLPFRLNNVYYTVHTHI